MSACRSATAPVHINVAERLIRKRAPHQPTVRVTTSELHHLRVNDDDRVLRRALLGRVLGHRIIAEFGVGSASSLPSVSRQHRLRIAAFAADAWRATAVRQRGVNRHRTRPAIDPRDHVHCMCSILSPLAQNLQARAKGPGWSKRLLLTLGAQQRAIGRGVPPPTTCTKSRYPLARCRGPRTRPGERTPTASCLPDLIAASCNHHSRTSGRRRCDFAHGSRHVRAIRTREPARTRYVIQRYVRLGLLLRLLARSSRRRRRLGPTSRRFESLRWPRRP